MRVSPSSKHITGLSSVGMSTVDSVVSFTCSMRISVPVSVVVAAVSAAVITSCAYVSVFG